ncbi:MAG: hypothetical protein JXR94_16030 [Candidatus Hydrogenedentes bacterium]|nr:hypothetical protein [Candidatus Hydrogenedentota bacterium]
MYKGIVFKLALCVGVGIIGLVCVGPSALSTAEMDSVMGACTCANATINCPVTGIYAANCAAGNPYSHCTSPGPLTLTCANWQNCNLTSGCAYTMRKKCQ